VLILRNEGAYLLIVAGTNRGFIEITAVPDEATKTIKTWYLNTPISKVSQIGPADYLCLDFVSQRLVKISITEEPSEIRQMTKEYQLTFLKTAARTDPIKIATNACKDET
jgi:hypothetical protein